MSVNSAREKLRKMLGYAWWRLDHGVDCPGGRKGPPNDLRLAPTPARLSFISTQHNF